MPVGKVTWTADGEWVNTKSYGQNCVVTYEDEVFVTLRPVEAGVRPANDGVNYRLLIKSPFIKPLIHSSNTFSGKLSELNGRKVLFKVPAASISLTLGESQGDECWFFFTATAGIQITMGKYGVFAISVRGRSVHFTTVTPLTSAFTTASGTVSMTPFSPDFRKSFR